MAEDLPSVLAALERADTSFLEGRVEEAEAVYRKIAQAGREGHYPGLHYEIASLSLGDLRRSHRWARGRRLRCE